MTNGNQRERYHDGKVTVEVARINDHDVTANLFGHMEDLRGILDCIPAAYRASTEIDLRKYVVRR